MNVGASERIKAWDAALLLDGPVPAAEVIAAGDRLVMALEAAEAKAQRARDEGYLEGYKAAKKMALDTLDRMITT